MSEAELKVREARDRLEQRVRGELVSARRDGPSQRERELRVSIILAQAEAYARAIIEAEREAPR